MNEIAGRPDSGQPVHVTHLLASDQRRGAEVFALELAQFLEERGVENQLIALSVGPPGGSLGGEVDRLKLSPVIVPKLRSAARGSVVIGHGSRALIAGTLATLGTGVPFIYRSIGDPGAWSGGSILRRLRVDAQLRRASAVVCLWQGAAVQLERRLKLPAGTVHVVPNAVRADRIPPVSPLRRTAARQRLGLANSDRVAAIVGALSPEKRPQLAIDAALAADAIPLVAGRGPLEPTMRELYQRRPVRFLGVVDNVAEVLYASDLLVLASETEGVPGVVIEAGLAAIPQVMSNVGGVGTLVEGQEDALVPADASVSEFAAAIRNTVEAAGDRGQASRELMLKKFSMAVVGPAWLELIEGFAGAMTSTTGR